MKKLLTFLLFTLSVFSCHKNSTTPEVTYDEVFQIRFKLDGVEYSKTLKQNELNAVSSVAYDDGQGNATMAHGPLFQLDNGLELWFHLGYFHIKSGDSTGNLQIVKHLLQIGTRKYKCLSDCDTTVTDGVEMSLMDKGTGAVWYSTRHDLTTFQAIPVTDEQKDSHFEIMEVKESSTTGYSKNAFIIKGTFGCTIFESQTGVKRVLTEGSFTCILAAY